MHYWPEVKYNLLLYKFWTGIMKCGQDFQQWNEIVQKLIYDRVSKVCMMHVIIV